MGYMPLNGRILVKELEDEKKEGIIIPKDPNLIKAEVIVTSLPFTDKDFFLPFAPDSIIYFERKDATLITLEDKTYYSVDYKNILGKE